LIHGFSWLALLQQPLALSNSGQLKQVLPSCFSMESAFPERCMRPFNIYAKTLIYFVFQTSLFPQNEETQAARDYWLSRSSVRRKMFELEALQR